MKYLNECPQITAWRERCEILEEKLNKMVDTSQKLIALLDKRNDIIRNLHTRLDKERERADMNFEMHRSAVKRFNNLPWYRKMFHKIYY